MVFNPIGSVGIVSDSGNSLYVLDLSKELPSLICRVKVECKGPIRSIDADFKSGYLFASSQDDGIISIYKSNDLSDANEKLELHASIKGFTNSRCIRYWKERNELFVGYTKGYLTVYKLDLESMKGKVIANPTCTFR